MRRTAPTLAWAVGLAGAVACVFGGISALWLGAPATFLLIYLVGALMGLLGALIAAREPANSIGWLMILTSFAAGLVHLPVAYGYAALVTERGAWPLGQFAVWLGAWGWVPILVFVPLIAVRFPDGRVPEGWRIVDLLAIGGTALFVIGIALQPAADLVGFMAIPGDEAVRLTPFATTPLAGLLSRQTLSVTQDVGIAMILAAFAASAVAVLRRFGAASGDERLQLKWFAYSGALIASAFLYGALAWGFFGQPLYLAFTPLEIATVFLPLAIGVAILRYRLYDIDLIINRTIVYVSLTAILAALYSAVVTLLQRLFISASGQSSDAAYVLTAFIVVVTFSPIKDWLQRQVDRRVARQSPVAVMTDFDADVNAVIDGLDTERLAARLLERAVVAFDAKGAALYLDSGGAAAPVFSRGQDVEPELVIALRHGDVDLGRLVMGPRRGAITYSEKDRLLLQQSADSVAEALMLATRFDRSGSHPSGPRARSRGCARRP